MVGTKLKFRLINAIAEAMASQDKQVIKNLFVQGVKGLWEMDEDSLYPLALHYLSDDQILSFFPYAEEALGRRKSAETTYHPWDEEDEEIYLAMAHHNLRRRIGFQVPASSPKHEVFCPVSRNE